MSKLFQFHVGFTDDFYRENSERIIIAGNWQEAGVVDSITITNGGSGYTSVPTVEFSGGGGSGAEAEAIITDDVVTSINITKQGKNYTTAPTIALTGGGGSNATATATISTITVQKADAETPTDLTDLVEGENYRFIKYANDEPGRNYPIVAVKLFSDYLEDRQFLRITGTYGFSPQVPNELTLDADLYNILKKATLNAENDTESGNRGTLVDAKIDKIQAKFESSDDSNGVNSTFEKTMNEVDKLLDSISQSYQFEGGYLTSIVG
ncbi:MAG: hypothetical protein ACFFDH_00060 [Promethearchaeota archaeon]